MPTFSFQSWLTGLAGGILLLALLTPFAFNNSRWIRPIFYFVAIVTGVFNAMGHTIATILGHTLSTIQFSRPAPGFYSSPLLFTAAIYALMQLRQTRAVH
jgi:hypothetical protein